MKDTPTRDAYGETLVELGADLRIVVLDAGVSDSTRSKKLVGTHTGLAVGEDGPSAQMIVDIAYTRAMPNMIVVQPADWEETRQATRALAEYEGPAYFRLGRPKVKAIFDSSYKFEIGKGRVVKKGSDLVIFATGIMVQESLKAMEMLEKENINVTLVNISTLKPGSWRSSKPMPTGMEPYLVPA